MGTLARIVAEGATDAAVQLAFARLRELDRCLSDYQAESELNRAVREAAVRPVALSADLAAVLGYAQKIARESEGAFDVTAGPFVRLWREARRLRALPPAAALAAARARCGYRMVTLRGAALSVSVPDMQFDLGGLAKGYAASQALRVLRAHGARRAMVAVAGDIAVAGGGWRIPVEHFGRVVERLVLRDAAVSTSGDAEQYVEIEGVRYSHIVDPRTGMALERSPAVSVVAPEGMEADALATAISVGGRGVMRGHGRARAIVTLGA